MERKMPSIQQELDFIDSIKSNYQPKTILVGNKNILKERYKDNKIESNILEKLNAINNQFRSINPSFNQAKYGYLYSQDSVFYSKSTPNLQTYYFQFTLAAIKNAEKDCLMEL